MTAAGTVLIVDDNPNDIDLLQIALDDAGLHPDIRSAADGRAAIAVLRHIAEDDHSWRPDVVVLDLNMPIANGHEVLAYIRSDPRLTALPVLVLTTSDAPSDRQRCLAQGAQAYLVKPRRFSEFEPIITRIRAYIDHPGTPAPTAVDRP
ncbi:MAG: response regulator [Planctomycetes bacterium]|nr:response regulator [Planctomycetota bacterium]